MILKLWRRCFVFVALDHRFRSVVFVALDDEDDDATFSSTPMDVVKENANDVEDHELNTIIEKDKNKFVKPLRLTSFLQEDHNNSQVYDEKNYKLSASSNKMIITRGQEQFEKNNPDLIKANDALKQLNTSERFSAILEKMQELITKKVIDEMKFEFEVSTLVQQLILEMDNEFHDSPLDHMTRQSVLSRSFTTMLYYTCKC
jgi:hypothetical protein